MATIRVHAGGMVEVHELIERSGPQSTVVGLSPGIRVGSKTGQSGSGDHLRSLFAAVAVGGRRTDGVIEVVGVELTLAPRRDPRTRILDLCPNGKVGT